MKNTKEFVLKIYPNAKVDDFGSSYGIYNGNGGVLLSAGFYEATERIAWNNTAEIIRKEMLRKFES
jgi:hypothetical protein